MVCAAVVPACVIASSRRRRVCSTVFAEGNIAGGNNGGAFNLASTELDMAHSVLRANSAPSHAGGAIAAVVGTVDMYVGERCASRAHTMTTPYSLHLLGVAG